MLLSHSKRFIYLKTGKTAGTSVEIFFQSHCLPLDHPCYHAPTHTMDETISDYGIVGYRGENPPQGTAFYNHMPAFLVKDLVGIEVWERYFKFCVIRNPFDKIVSFWWFRLPASERESLNLKDFSLVKSNFKDWILTNKIFPVDNSIYKINDSICVDHFIRFENLIDDIQSVTNKLILPFDISKLERYKSDSRKKNNHFSEYYDNETIKIVKNMFSWELSHFGYHCS